MARRPANTGRGPLPSHYGVLAIRRVMRSFPLLAGSKVQLEIDRPLGWPDAADVIPQARHAAAISFLPQTLQDLLSAVRLGVHQPRDAGLAWIKDTTALPSPA